MSRMKDGIVKRGGTWSYVIRVPDPETGKTKPQWIGGFQTQTEAKAARNEARTQARKGTWVAPTKMRTGEYLARWLEGRVSKLKASTIHSYRRNLEAYTIPVLGADRLQELSPARLESFYEDLLRSGGQDGRPLSVRTVRYAHAILRKALSDAVGTRLLQVNPAGHVELPKRLEGGEKKTKGIRAWDAKTVRHFVEALDGHLFHALFVLAVNTGLRRSELLGLTWPDVDFEEGRLHVRRAAVPVKEEVHYDVPKSGKTRSFKLDPVSLHILQERKREQASHRLAWPGEWGIDRDLMFTWEDGRQIHPDRVTRRFRNLVDELGLPYIRLHDLRHTYATLALQAGVREGRLRAVRARDGSAHVGHVQPRAPGHGRRGR